jgi:hypothetical protein
VTAYSIQADLIDVPYGSVSQVPGLCSGPRRDASLCTVRVGHVHRDQSNIIRVTMIESWNLAESVEVGAKLYVDRGLDDEKVTPGRAD